MTGQIAGSTLPKRPPATKRATGPEILAIPGRRCF
jgi:hypothetical protein